MRPKPPRDVVVVLTAEVVAERGTFCTPVLLVTAWLSPVRKVVSPCAR